MNTSSDQSIQEFESSVLAYESKFLPEGQIIDGPFRPEEYFKSPIKISWMLKEGYTSEQKSWHIRKLYDESDPYNHFFKGKWAQTWHPIIYASYSVQNDFAGWTDMDKICDDPDMCHAVKSISLLNANKWGSKTGTFTITENLINGFNDSWPITKLQIETLRPDVLVFGGTFFLYKEKLALENDKHFLGSKGACNVWKKDGQLFIDAMHPAQRSIGGRLYFESIISAIKEEGPPLLLKNNGF